MERSDWLRHVLSDWGVRPMFREPIVWVIGSTLMRQSTRRRLMTLSWKWPQIGVLYCVTLVDTVVPLLTVYSEFNCDDITKATLALEFERIHYHSYLYWVVGVRLSIRFRASKFYLGLLADIRNSAIMVTRIPDMEVYQSSMIALCYYWRTKKLVRMGILNKGL